jgi:hypothetical protein
MNAGLYFLAWAACTSSLSYTIKQLPQSIRGHNPPPNAPLLAIERASCVSRIPTVSKNVDNLVLSANSHTSSAVPSARTSSPNKAVSNQTRSHVGNRQNARCSARTHGRLQSCLKHLHITNKYGSSILCTDSPQSRLVVGSRIAFSRHPPPASIVHKHALQEGYDVVKVLQHECVWMMYSSP